MEKYRKPDSFYIDMYDRTTIRELKKLEAKEAAELQNENDPVKRFALEVSFGVDLTAYRNKAISRARNREEIIRSWIASDENQDRLIERHPVPKGITCDRCGKTMRCSDAVFDMRSIPLLFLFDCPTGHKSRKIIYPNGQEFVLPRPTCKKCGYEVSEESYKNNGILYTTSTCSMCGSVERDELDLHVEPDEEFVITEEDRQKYCLSFLKERTFLEDLVALTNVLNDIDEDQKKNAINEQYEVDKIEKITIPNLESRLKEVIENEGFIKFIFDRPEMKKVTTVPFNLQDPTPRDSKKSIKTITNCIKKALFHTNWRITGSIDYRLGLLTGKLKAHESEDDLLKLAKEIKDSECSSDASAGV